MYVYQHFHLIVDSMCFAIYELNVFESWANWLACELWLMKLSGTPCDVAGEVVTVGGVKKLKAGDKVVAMLNFIVSFERKKKTISEELILRNPPS